MQNKKVVYLDQNFASNLAKSCYLEGWKDSLAPFYRELNDILANLTNSDQIICPSSPFHTEESELCQRISSFIWHFMEQLGYGLFFKHSPEIKNHQITTAALVYCGLSTTNHLNWIAFNRDPQISINQLQQPPLLVNIPTSQEFNEYFRLSRASIADEYWTYKTSCKGKRLTFADELETQKKQLILDIFKPRTTLNIKSSRLEQCLTLLGLASVIQFVYSVDEILQHSNNPGGFFVSPQLLDCPYIHIWASLMAADIFFYPDMKPTSSLFADFEILATVLPYVDILATDSYMVQLISRGRLTERYGTHTFSVRQRKVLVEELRNL